MTCEGRERDRIEELEVEEEEKNRMRRQIRLHEYVGETSRSMYERSLEHPRDLAELKPEKKDTQRRI